MALLSRQVSKQYYLLFVIYSLFSVCYLSMHLVRRCLSLLTPVLSREVIVYMMSIYSYRQENTASDYVDLLLLLLELVRRVRVHKHGSIDK